MVLAPGFQLPGANPGVSNSGFISSVSNLSPGCKRPLPANAELSMLKHPGSSTLKRLPIVVPSCYLLANEQ